ncbi:MAG: hypothetical protein ACLQRM_04315 [Acidimicrobiales bacterium]
MRLRRKIVTVIVSVACGLALAACGQQVVAKVKAGDSVKTALTGVFNSSTTRLDITAQDLPGIASLADGSFSIVITTSRNPGTSASTQDESAELSIYHGSTDLMDLSTVGGSDYLRADLADILVLAGPTEYAAISGDLNTLAARPGFGYLHNLLLGQWLGISTSTLVSAAQQLAASLPSAAASIANVQKLTQNLQKLSQLRVTVSSSFSQAVRTWLSIHQDSADEYSVTLPVRSFANALVSELAKPVEALLNEPSISSADIAKGLNDIPADLSLNANLWVTNGSVTKIQAFIPRTTSGYLLIGVSHPSAPVAAPTGASMLTAGDITALYGLVPTGALKTLGTAGVGSVNL